MKVQITPTKTYGAEKMVDLKVAEKGFDDLRYIVMRTEDGRFFPLFIGEAALHRGVHFHFCVTN